MAEDEIALQPIGYHEVFCLFCGTKAPLGRSLYEAQYGHPG